MCIFVTEEWATNYTVHDSTPQYDTLTASFMKNHDWVKSLNTVSMKKCSFYAGRQLKKKEKEFRAKVKKI